MSSLLRRRERMTIIPAGTQNGTSMLSFILLAIRACMKHGHHRLQQAESAFKSPQNNTRWRHKLVWYVCTWTSIVHCLQSVQHPHTPLDQSLSPFFPKACMPMLCKPVRNMINCWRNILQTNSRHDHKQACNIQFCERNWKLDSYFWLVGHSKRCRSSNSVGHIEKWSIYFQSKVV